MSDCIALLNMKGGVGKTTLAVNLAYYAYTHGKKRVLLIDLDPQFNASQYLMDFRDWQTHQKNNGTIADILIDSPRLELKAKKKPVAARKRIVKLKKGTASYFDFLPSELALGHVVKNPAQMEYKLEKLLQELREDYDLIFIDCAPTDSVLTTMALTASNFFLVPVRPDRFSILGFANLQSTVEQFRAASHDPNNVRDLGIVFTQVRGNSAVETECMNDVAAQAITLGSHVFTARLDYSPTFIRAVQDQTPVYQTKYARDDLKASVSFVYREMMRRIAQLKTQ
ncbi:MAG: ParA family protein [Vicinamibacterales bacterium]